MKIIPFAAPVRLFAAMPLIFGLATVLAVPTAHAVTINQVDIIDGKVDVNEDGVISVGGVLDDLANVMLSCNGGTLIRVDIIDGKVDVNEGGAVLTNDDLNDCKLTKEVAGFPTTEQVDIIDGQIDVTESGVISVLDDANDIQLFVLP